MQTVSEIKELLNGVDEAAFPAFAAQYAADSRQSVQKLLQAREKALLRQRKELERLEGLRSYELNLADGRLFCGIDEAGRGPLAGPVVAAAAVMCEPLLPKVNDSKQLSEKVREELYDQIREHALAYGIGIVDWQRIDEINILQATYEAMRMAIHQVEETLAEKGLSLDLLINDAVTIPDAGHKQIAVIKGDALCYSISCASILAKVTRDRQMIKYDQQFPGYGFASNKGYGSAEHIDAIHRLGLCPIHRKSFTHAFVKED